MDRPVWWQDARLYARFHLIYNSICFALVMLMVWHGAVVLTPRLSLDAALGCSSTWAFVSFVQLWGLKFLGLFFAMCASIAAKPTLEQPFLGKEVKSSVIGAGIGALTPLVLIALAQGFFGPQIAC